MGGGREKLERAARKPATDLAHQKLRSPYIVMPLVSPAVRLATLAISLALAAPFTFAVRPAMAATPPAQPKSGPGGADNPTAEIVKRAVGQASNVTFVYYAAGVPSAPRPVVVLLHAWGTINPSAYGGWIDHLARRGFLVLFPSFQDIGRTRPVDATARTQTLVKDALAALAEDAEAKPDTGRLAYLGHSAGAALAINMAAMSTPGVLPEPKLVFMMMTGGIASDAGARGIQLADLSQIGEKVDLVTLVGDREFQASERASRRILRETTSVPLPRKLFVRAGSDDHGFPALSATLASPASPMEGYDSASIKLPPDPPRDPKAPRIVQPRWSPDMVLSGEQTVLSLQIARNPVDTLDYLAFWKTFDRAVDLAFANGEVSTLRNDGGFLDMGRWSDGWPVRRISAEMVKPADAVAAVRAAPIPSKLPTTRQARQRRRP